jgi:hypothetical protein
MDSSGIKSDVVSWFIDTDDFERLNFAGNYKLQNFNIKCAPFLNNKLRPKGDI